MSAGTLIEARRPPRYGALVSIGINLTTAMLLVDYALHGLTAPTPWAGAVAARLPPPLRRRFDDLRAFLGHGAVVREFLLGELGEGAREHRDWPALRAWLAALAPQRVEAMVAAGIVANLDYYRENAPSPEVRDLLARIPRTGAGLPDFGLDGTREAGLRAVIAGWGVPRPAAAHRLALDPESLRAALLEILDALWQAGFEEAWSLGRPALAAAAAEAEARGAQPEPVTPEAFVAWVTGLQPDTDIAALLRGAERVVFAPCLHLGGYLSIVAAGGGRFVLYAPQVGGATPKAAGQGRAGGQEGRPAAQALALAALGPALEALGDATRLAILLRMRERGELTAQQAAEDLGVHQSTISRHFARLEQAELVRVRRDEGVRHYRVDEARIGQVSEMLRRALTGGHAG